MKPGKIFYCACLLLTMALPIGAENLHGITGRELADNELGDLRGKFVSGRDIVYFGVMMQTQWQTSSGYTHNMQMQMDINLAASAVDSNPFRPTLTINRSTNLGTVQSANTPVSRSENFGAGSLHTVSGVLQNIQAAGDDNTVANNISWEVTEQAAPAPPQPPPPGLVTVTQSGNATLVNDAGVVSDVRIEPGSLGYTIQVPDTGRVTQLIRSGGSHGTGIFQSTQLSSDQSRISNSIQLSVGLARQSAGVSRSSINRTLQSLQGLW